MNTDKGQHVPLKSWTQYGDDGGLYVNTLIPLDSNMSAEQTKTTTTEIGFNGPPATPVQPDTQHTQQQISTQNQPAQQMVTQQQSQIVTQPQGNQQIVYSEPATANDNISGPTVANLLFNKNEMNDVGRQNAQQDLIQQQQQQQQQIQYQQQQQQATDQQFQQRDEQQQQQQLQQQKQEQQKQQRDEQLQQQKQQQQKQQQQKQQMQQLQRIKFQQQQALKQQQQQQQVLSKQALQQTSTVALQQQQQQMAAALVEQFNQLSSSDPNAVVTSGFHETSSRFNPLTGMQDIPLGTMIIPTDGMAGVSPTISNAEPNTHVLGDNKHSVPKLDQTNNTLVKPAVFHIQQSVKKLPQSNNIQPAKTITTDQLLALQPQIIQTNSLLINNDKANNIEKTQQHIQAGFSGNAKETPAITNQLREEGKENSKQYPQPKDFGMDFILQKKKESLIKQQNEEFWKQNRQAESLKFAEGDYPQPVPFQLKPTNLTQLRQKRPSWPQQPMKLKVSFEPTTEGKVEMKINGPFDQFGKKITVATSPTATNQQPINENRVESNNYAQLSNDDKARVQKLHDREFQMEAARNKMESKYIAPINRNYKVPPVGRAFRPSDPTAGLRRPLVRVAIPKTINSSVVLTSQMPMNRNGNTNGKVKTLSIKLPINVSLSTVLKNIYEHMYEYYFHKRPMLGTQKEDPAAKKVIQGLIEANMKNLTRVVQTNSIADSRQSINDAMRELTRIKANDMPTTVASLHPLKITRPANNNTISKTPEKSKTMLSLQNAKLNSMLPIKIQHNLDKPKNLKNNQLNNKIIQLRNVGSKVKPASSHEIQSKPISTNGIQGPSEATLAEQKDLYKKLTSRQKNKFLPLNDKNGDFNENSLNGILVSEVPEDADGITRSFHQPVDWHTFQGSIESYLGTLQNLQQSNKLAFHNDVVQPMLNMPLAVISDEHARRRSGVKLAPVNRVSRVKFDPLNNLFLHIKGSKPRTGLSRTSVSRLPIHRYESESTSPMESSNQRDIKGPSIFGLSKDQSTDQFNKKAQEYVSLKVKTKEGNPNSIGNVALRLQNEGVQASSKPANYFLIDTTGVANNKPMVIQTVEEFMKKQALRKKLRREKKLKQEAMRKEAYEAAQRLQQNSEFVQQYLPLGSTENQQTNAQPQPNSLQNLQQNQANLDQHQGNTEQYQINTAQQPFVESNAQTKINNQQVSSPTYNDQQPLIPNQIMSVPDDNQVASQYQNTQTQSPGRQAESSNFAQNFENQNENRPSQRQIYPVNQVYAPAAQLNQDPLINKQELTQQRHSVNPKKLLYNAPYLLHSGEFKQNDGQSLANKLSTLASKRLIATPVKAVFVPKHKELQNKASFNRQKQLEIIKSLERTPGFNIGDEAVTPVQDKVKEFVNANVAKGSAYTYQEELEESLREKMEGKQMIKPTMDPSELIHSLKDPNWDKKVHVPDPRDYDQVVSKRSFNQKTANHMVAKQDNIAAVKNYQVKKISNFVGKPSSPVNPIIGKQNVTNLREKQHNKRNANLADISVKHSGKVRVHKRDLSSPSNNAENVLYGNYEELHTINKRKTNTKSLFRIKNKSDLVRSVTKRSLTEIKTLFQAYKKQHHTSTDIHRFIKRLKKRLTILKKKKIRSTSNKHPKDSKKVRVAGKKEHKVRKHKHSSNVKNSKRNEIIHKDNLKTNAVSISSFQTTNPSSNLSNLSTFQNKKHSKPTIILKEKHRKPSSSLIEKHRKPSNILKEKHSNPLSIPNEKLSIPSSNPNTLNGEITYKLVTPKFIHHTQNKHKKTKKIYHRKTNQYTKSQHEESLVKQMNSIRNDNMPKFDYKSMVNHNKKLSKNLESLGFDFNSRIKEAKGMSLETLNVNNFKGNLHDNNLEIKPSDYNFEVKSHDNNLEIKPSDNNLEVKSHESNFEVKPIMDYSESKFNYNNIELKPRDSNFEFKSRDNNVELKELKNFAELKPQDNNVASNFNNNESELQPNDNDVVVSSNDNGIDSVSKENNLNRNSQDNSKETGSGSAESLFYEELSLAAKEKNISIGNAIASLKHINKGEFRTSTANDLMSEASFNNQNEHPGKELVENSFVRVKDANINLNKNSFDKAEKKKNFKKSEIEKFTFNIPRPVSQNIFNDVDMGADKKEDKNKGGDFLTNSMELQEKTQPDFNFSSK